MLSVPKIHKEKNVKNVSAIKFYLKINVSLNVLLEPTMIKNSKHVPNAQLTIV